MWRGQGGGEWSPDGRQRASVAARRLTAAAVLSVVAVIGIAGCGGGGAKANAADNSFLSDIHDSAPDIATYRSDVELLRLGNAACEGFRSGASFEVLADRLSLLEGSNPLPPTDLGTVLSASLAYLCPQYQATAGG